MKHTAFAGLFISAALLASPVFAADLCETNLTKIRNDMVSTKQLSEDLKTDLNMDVAKAEEAHQKGTEEGTKDCIAITTQALQKLQNNAKGDPQ
ncbi:hypothetical protein LOY64_04080 [Pseudomonas corrugata]|uniref:Uncharacterized protein n=1 Tax=Pseudomonas corrugata TaxID=47879 RepID=A0A8B6UT54_9PSED|nr:hypothetical protein [Pseudomonas corrugata]AOE63811.1 hypothetical protein AXG94_19285 [Pseudomonas corrugata]MDU9023993.1 hypothetical protein [Pseudomonas corrugata]MDU9033168.1 hypothetical protein [Pseudomonas corrugata]MDU9041221.1 hypothetical protein [Pseudomonas corrugata]QTH15081.1 hypothetical protein C4C32_04015 [Pseudomonas corrugata]